MNSLKPLAGAFMLAGCSFLDAPDADPAATTPAARTFDEALAAGDHAEALALATTPRQTEQAAHPLIRAAWSGDDAESARAAAQLAENRRWTFDLALDAAIAVTFRSADRGRVEEFVGLVDREARTIDQRGEADALRMIASGEQSAITFAKAIARHPGTKTAVSAAAVLRTMNRPVETLLRAPAPGAHGAGSDHPKYIEAYLRHLVARRAVILTAMAETANSGPEALDRASVQRQITHEARLEAIDLAIDAVQTSHPSIEVGPEELINAESVNGAADVLTAETEARADRERWKQLGAHVRRTPPPPLGPWKRVRS